MVRFESKRRPRNYLARREQWRLLALVFALGLVFFFMRQVRQPEATALLEQVFTGDAGESTAERRIGDAAMTELASERRDQLAFDAFRTPTTIESDADAADGYFAGVRPALLGTIRDNSAFRSDETGVWFHLWEVLQSTSEQQLADASVGDIGYAQFIEQPAVYRGHVVTVRGTVRRVETVRPAANELGIEQLHVLTLRPAGSQIWPIRVYCLELPSEFPQGDNVTAEISATGFFFKNWSYQWQGGLGLAPVVLARDVAWREPTNVVASEKPAPSLAIVVSAAVALAVGLVGYVVWSSRPRAMRRVASRLQSVLVGGIVFCAAELLAQTPQDDFREILAIDGWDDAAWAEFSDGQPLGDDDVAKLMRLVRRLRSFDALSIERWMTDNADLADVVASAELFHDRLVHVRGELRRLERHELGGETYFLAEIAVDEAFSTTVLTANVPTAWNDAEPFDEPVSFAGLPVKRTSGDGEPPRLALVASRIAWHPTSTSGVNDSFGRAALGSAGMDVGLFDTIANNSRIRPVEREAFYQMLDAAGRLNPQRLVQHAERELPHVAARWEADTDAAPQRQLLAKSIVARAGEGRYSVAPLFNDADEQIGNLVVLDGLARRAVRIEVGRTAGGLPSDVARRFGIDHYFEVDVFTDDSQNYPVVFCVRRLPEGFPTGEKIREPVRVAGFFFKKWLHDTRRGVSNGAKAEQQFAPLLVGPGPLWIQPNETAASPLAGIVGGTLVVLAIIGIWAFAVWSGRGDEQFRKRAFASRYTLPEDVSLDEVISDDEVGLGFQQLEAEK